ncbi:MAG: hypothetical protein ACRD2D_05615 [Terriglobales bacterium]
MGKRLDEEALYQKAVQALARRDRSEREMRQWLRPRAATAAAIEAVVARLRDHGYLNDARMAVHRAAYDAEVNRHGSERALRNLRARGVAAPLAAQAVAQSYRGRNENAQLRAYLRKKRIAAPHDPRRTAQVFRRLRLAGFSTAACTAALRAWKLDPEWIEAIETADADSAMLEQEPNP